MVQHHPKRYLQLIKTQLFLQLNMQWVMALMAKLFVTILPTITFIPGLEMEQWLWRKWQERMLPIHQ